MILARAARARSNLKRKEQERLECFRNWLHVADFITAAEIKAARKAGNFELHKKISKVVVVLRALPKSSDERQPSSTSA